MSDSTMVEQTEDVVRWRQSTAEANTRLQIGSDRHESVNIWKQVFTLDHKQRKHYLIVA